MQRKFLLPGKTLPSENPRFGPRKSLKLVEGRVTNQEDASEEGYVPVCKMSTLLGHPRPMPVNPRRLAEIVIMNPHDLLPLAQVCGVLPSPRHLSL
jgi:hypothetical protein